MTHTYNVSGMTCSSCQSKVQQLLSGIAGVKNVSVDLDKAQAEIEMDKHIPTEVFQAALKDYPKYQLSEAARTPVAFAEPEPKSWLATYKPLLLIFIYISVVTVIISRTAIGFDSMLAMRVFMGAFFLVFSFFKMLDLKGFAESYAMYDIIAKRIPQWGYVYAFAELVLGLAYIIDFQPFITNAVTFVILTISIIGVLQSILDKRKIKCACLGAIFDLPMSTVTVIEDGLMIVMSGIMLFMLKS